MKASVFVLFASLLCFLFSGCRMTAKDDDSEVLQNAPGLDSLNRYMEFWARQEGGIPCDPSDTYCGRSFPLPKSNSQFGLVSDVIGPSSASAGNADISSDVTNLLNKEFVDSLNNFNCSSTSDVVPTPFFSGIQGQDKIILFVSADSTTANFYTNNATPSLEDSNSLIRHWKLLHYYNQPKVTPPNPSTIQNADGTYVDSYYRENRFTYRYTTRKSDGTVKRWGDQTEARLLGIWTVAEGQRFHTHSPLFAGSNADEDEVDFAEFYRVSINQPEWKRFMYDAAWDVGLALKCGLPVLVHSGGGSVGGFLIRLLSEKPGLHIAKWRPGGKFVLIGLEAVLTEGAKDLFNRLPVLGGRVVMENHVVGKSLSDLSGSDVWRDTIAPELMTAGFIPLKTHAAVGAATSFWNPIEGGHGGVGFYPLRYGRLPNYLFPVP